MSSFVCTLLSIFIHFFSRISNVFINIDIIQISAHKVKVVCLDLN